MCSNAYGVEWFEIYSGKGQLEETCSYVAQCTLRHKLGRGKLSSLLATYQGEVCFKQICLHPLLFGLKSCLNL
jgi:hypothetical protein